MNKLKKIDMKHIVIIFGLVVISFASCSKMHDNVKEFATEETVYPGRFDGVIRSHIGFERVELDLMAVGRIPSSEMNLGKAIKTVVEYGVDGKLVVDSVVSWVNVPDLTLKQTYRFKVYTVDKYGDKSIPVEGTATPYTEDDLRTLALPSPKTGALSATSMEISWSRMSSVLLDYYRMTYSYTDKDNNKREGSSTGENPVIVLDNLAPGQQVTLTWKCRIIPKINNVPIIDSVWWERPPLTFKMP
jgi:hypothetical protein